ncbi:hypothetical protein [Miniphocaeibacter massiliensis]|nr:hypothetical protein [Miniphocaeibacter massiliensis]
MTYDLDKMSKEDIEENFGNWLDDSGNCKLENLEKDIQYFKRKK